jgi:hypothetical protein
MISDVRSRRIGIYDKFSDQAADGAELTRRFGGPAAGGGPG